MVRRIVAWGTLVLMLLGATVYVVNAFLYLTPPNPLKAAWLPLIVGLAHPLFAQNWHLFAPDPIRTNYVLLARCRTRAGITPWVDVTQSMLGRHHRARTSPMSRLLRVHLNAMRLAIGVSHDEWRQYACKRDIRSAACRGKTETGSRRREIGTYLLQRTASTVCDQRVGLGTAEAVQTRILVHTPPPWSRRSEPPSAGVTRFVPMPWTPYVPAR
ncbi:MAG: DUF5819 family protein [Armatimonadota bacterium]|nr:DUF5819 family protein [Armatimonadota bacterium]